MDKPHTLLRHSIPRWLWWAAAAVVVCLVAAAVGLGVYASRRAAALQRLSNVRLRAPSFVPVGLYPWLPEWALQVQQVEGKSREEWQALSAFPEVEAVIFQDARLTDEDLQQLRRMRRLVRFWIYRNPDITAAGMTHLEGLPRLADVHINCSKIGDAGVRSLATLPELRALELYETDATGATLSSLRTSRKLRYLLVEVDRFSPATLGEFEKVEAVEELRLYGWNVDNDSVRHLRLPPRLSRLDLRSTGIFDNRPGDPVEGLAAVAGIERLEVLDLNGHFQQASIRKRLSKRLGMVETVTPGVFRRVP